MLLFNSIYEEEEKKLQQKKAMELCEALESQGFAVGQPNTSITDFGVSTYVGFYDEFGVYRKFRISDHDVSNIDRIFKEYHYTLDSQIKYLVEAVKSDIEKSRKKIVERNKLFAEDNERTRLADEKWDKIKDRFKSLVFKINNRTYQNLEQFSKNGKRTNIFQKSLGKNDSGIAYYYEWTEPKNNDGYGNSKPSREFIEQYSLDN